MNTAMNATISPYLSCIVATYNAEKTLPILLESLKKQNLQDIEIIIQDGGSKDGTLAILETWRNVIPNLILHSAPDKGIYDAWNKALDHVNGKWVLFLGADDTWVNSTSAEQALAQLKTLPDDVIYLATPVAVVPHSGDKPSLEDGSLLQPLVPVEKHIPQGMALPHQGLFHRASLFQNRRFDTSFRIAGDYDFLSRTYAIGAIHTNKTPLVCMAAGGVSSSFNSMWRCEWEQLSISRQRFPKAIPWKLCMRLLRSLVYLGLLQTVGMHRTAQVANTMRKIMGRPPLWDIPK